MPIREYICLDCSICFEVLELTNKKKRVLCPKCSSKRINKMISKSTFQLKGEGWFRDGYTKKPKK